MTEKEPLKIFCRNCRIKLDISELPPFTYFDCPECGTTIRVPEQFGRYLLEKVCAEGRISTVYRAIDRKLARRVAVKILAPEHTGERDLCNAAKLTALINHPSVVPVLDCGSIDGKDFQVMKYMDMGDLGKLIRQENRPPLAQLALHLHSVTSGLAAAAEQSIAHHSVSPANMLLSVGSNAMISNFDLADTRDYGDTFTPCAEGDINYLSPERLISGGEDQRGDIFSLGISMYELFSGTLPFGSGLSPEEACSKREQMLFPSLKQRVPQMPEYFSALVNTMLAFDENHRPDYSLILAALERLSRERI